MHTRPSSTDQYAGVWTAPFGKGNVLYYGWNWRTLGWTGDKGGADWTAALAAGLNLAPFTAPPPYTGSPPVITTTAKPSVGPFKTCTNGKATKGLFVENMCVNTNCGSNRGPCKTNACKLSDSSAVSARTFNGRDGADGYCCNDFHAFCLVESCKWPLKGFVGKCYHYKNIPGSNLCLVGQKKSSSNQCVACSGTTECPSRAEIVAWAKNFKQPQTVTTQTTKAATTQAATTKAATTQAATTQGTPSGYTFKGLGIWSGVYKKTLSTSRDVGTCANACTGLKEGCFAFFRHKTSGVCYTYAAMPAATTWSVK